MSITKLVIPKSSNTSTKSVQQLDSSFSRDVLLIAYDVNVWEGYQTSHYLDCTCFTHGFKVLKVPCQYKIIDFIACGFGIIKIMILQIHGSAQQINKVNSPSVQHETYHQQVFDLAPVAWAPHSSPRMVCCLLRTLCNRLLTRNRLWNFEVIDQDVRAPCNLATKTSEHLFFSCPYSAYIWAICKLKWWMN